MDASKFVRDSRRIINSILFRLAKEKNSETNYNILTPVNAVNFTPNEATAFDG